MDLVRIATAGSVDDGKSTLIGRLLVETGSVPRDRLKMIEAASRRRGFDTLDVSLLTDGLTAERAQGITIDVGHVYFATPGRQYVIADTPGHVEYTRNMITGASTAALSIILVDASKGPVEQTVRHLFIAALLRVPEIVVCVNKMDLVNWQASRFHEVAAAIRALAGRHPPPAHGLHIVPTSSLSGDNIASVSARMPWYTGPTILDILEQARPLRAVTQARLQVQHVIRTSADGARRYAGRIASGRFAMGDPVVVLPGGSASRIVGLERGGHAIEWAGAGASVSVQLAHDLDLSRGGLLATPGDTPPARAQVLARLCWLDTVPSLASGTYVLQHGVRRVKARLQHVFGGIDVMSLRVEPGVSTLRLNEIGIVRLRLSEPIFADEYTVNPANGAFVLIDERTHQTVAVGFIEDEPVAFD